MANVAILHELDIVVRDQLGNNPQDAVQRRLVGSYLFCIDRALRTWRALISFNGT